MGRLLAAQPAAEVARATRLRAMVDAHFAFLWRMLRRLGVPEAEADDATQQVFLVASPRLEGIAPTSERSFLLSVALKTAANMRRASARKRAHETGEDQASEVLDPAPGPDELLDEARSRALADRILESLPLELRVVLVLFEVEEMTAPAIAALLDLPVGTVASRLRRARDEAQSRARKMGLCGLREGGAP